MSNLLSLKCGLGRSLFVSKRNNEENDHSGEHHN